MFCDKLVEYEEAVQQESSARNVKIDIDDIWRVKPEGKSKSENGAEAEESGESEAKPDVDKLKRAA